jgi:hypothetical protein
MAKDMSTDEDMSTDDARPCAERGWCDSTVPVCDCGRRWEFRSKWLGTTTYTSALVVERYRALYGEPKAFTFERVET